jgi:hypothetical protein
VILLCCVDGGLNNVRRYLVARKSGTNLSVGGRCAILLAHKKSNQ